MTVTLKAFQEEIKKLLLKYPSPDSLQQLLNVIEEFMRIEKVRINRIIKETLHSNPAYAREEIEIAFRQVFREHFNI
jgi:hypothetical protein